MNEVQKKETTSFVVGSGAGFLLGWLLHRPKKASAGGLVLSDLAITSEFGPVDSGYSGLPITISCNIENTGSSPVIATVIVQVGNQILTQDLTVSGKMPVIFDYTLPGTIDGMWTVTVSVASLTAVIAQLQPI